MNVPRPIYLIFLLTGMGVLLNANLNAQIEFPVDLSKQEWIQVIAEVLYAPQKDGQMHPVLKAIDRHPSYSVYITESSNPFDWNQSISIYPSVEDKGYHPDLDIPIQFTGQTIQVANPIVPEGVLSEELKPYGVGLRLERCRYKKLRDPETGKIIKDATRWCKLEFFKTDPYFYKFGREKEIYTGEALEAKYDTIRRIYARGAIRNEQARFKDLPKKYQKALVPILESMYQFRKFERDEKPIDLSRVEQFIQEEREKPVFPTTKLKYAGNARLDDCNRLYINGRTMNCIAGDCINGTGTIQLEHAQFVGTFYGGFPLEGKMTSPAHPEVELRCTFDAFKHHARQIRTFIRGEDIGTFEPDKTDFLYQVDISSMVENNEGQTYLVRAQAKSLVSIPVNAELRTIYDGGTEYVHQIINNEKSNKDVVIYSPLKTLKFQGDTGADFYTPVGEWTVTFQKDGTSFPYQVKPDGDFVSPITEDEKIGAFIKSKVCTDSYYTRKGALFEECKKY